MDSIKKVKIFLIMLAIISFTSSFSYAIESPIGEPVEINGMKIAAVYLQPVIVEPDGVDTPRSLSDIHLEADIHAIKGNENGFGAGEWIPYLTISYTLIKMDTGDSVSGELIPMIANDGPHYGTNLKMSGIGDYKLILHIEPPAKNGFGRHADRETGVGRWWEPFNLEWRFRFFGQGKKGGY